jgi:glycosyltransferase involved in cell wall biosynthesis
MRRVRGAGLRFRAKTSPTLADEVQYMLRGSQKSSANDVKVSVIVMTYNHEAFVSQALESVLAQDATFAVEIIVSEDCSTDKTRDIVMDYAARYPDVIRLVLSDHNLRNNEVVARGIRVARGTYVALLDGDDYWISPQKLQHQVDLLDSHPRSAVCFHNAQVIYDDGSREPHLWTPAEQKQETYLEEIWAGNFIATSSVMFRNHLIGEIPSWYIPMFPITDWPLHILHAERGSISFINEVMSIYRQHRGGLYSPLSEAEKQDATRRFYKVMNRNLNYKYDRLVKGACSNYFFEWAQEYLDRGDMGRARYCASVSLLTGGIKNPRSVLRTIKLGLQTYARPKRVFGQAIDKGSGAGA